MTIDLADRRTIPEAGRLPEQLSFKVAANDDDPVGGQTIGVDEAEGRVTAIVSVTGVVDDVDDIIIPGAYRQTLMKRRPKVCWAHAWEHPIGRVLHIEELHPGDKRLPTKQRNGQPWPKDAGALVAVMEFNLRSDEGKQAFEAVRFYSETGECEWSIGYNVPPGGATKNSKGIRLIKMLDLYELSVVLFGAHSMTGTLSIKAAIAAIRTKTGLASGLDVALLLAHEGKAAPPPFTSNDDPNTTDGSAGDANAAAAEGDQPEGDAEPGADEGEDPQPDFSDGVMIAVYPDQAAAQAIANAISGPDDTTPKDDLHVTLAYLGKVGELSITEQALNDLIAGAAEGSPALHGTVGGLGVFPPNEDPEAPDEAPTWVPVDVPGLALLREQVCGSLGDMVYDDHGFTPHMTLGWGLGLIQPLPEIPVTFDRVSVVVGNSRRDLTLENLPGNTDGTKAVTGPDAWYLTQETGEGEVFAEAKRSLTQAQRRKKPTLPGSDTAWPIGDTTDLDAALKRYNAMGDDPDKAKVKRWIVKRARELDALSHLPDDWNVTKSLTAYDPDYDRRLTEADVWFEIDGYDVKAEGGADRNRGGAERLRHYWTSGPGAVKIAWGTPGDWRRCVAELGKYMGDRAKGYCFTGDTEFITRDGVTTFADAVGTDVFVLTQEAPTGPHAMPVRLDGRWVEAPIKSFGEQPVLSVTLRRNRQTKVIRATREHVWFASTDNRSAARQTTREVTTADLRPGMTLASLMPAAHTHRSLPSPFGVAAGVVFGDGHVQPNRGALVDLWGDKDAHLLRYFTEARQEPRKTANGVLGVRVSGLPASWKARPSLDEGYAFLYGWLAGYIAADGSVGKRGDLVLSSANRDDLVFAATVANRLGIATHGIRSHMRTGLGSAPTPLHRLRFVGATVPEDLLVLPEHKARFYSAGRGFTSTRWTVQAVEDHGEREEVFCAEVPGTATFALADYVWTHNCADRHKEVTGMWPGDKRNKSFAVPEGAKMFPNMPGSYQERIELIRQAVADRYENEALDEGQRRWFDLMAVYDDHCVYTVEVNGDTGECDRQTFLAPYYLDDDADAVVVGDPQQVELEVVALAADAEDADYDTDGAQYETDDDVPLGDGMPYAETLDAMTASLKAVVASTQRREREGKAGRVLSGANERALRSAYQHLGNILAAAGINIDEVTPENPTPLANNTSTGTGSESDPRYVVDPRSDVETTSPDATIKSAQPTEQADGTFVLDAADLAKTLEAFEV